MSGVALAAYATALRGDFVSDDQPLIVLNEFLKKGGWLAIFRESLWGPTGDREAYYRPIPVLLFKACYSLFGVRPEPFHAVDVAFHAGASALVYLLARRVAPIGPAVLAGLLFAVHPVHVEAVAWIAGVMDVACAFFTLLALHLHLSATARSRVAAAIAFFLALLCKEVAIVTPAIVVGLDLLERRRITLRHLAPMGVAFGAYAGLRFAAGVEGLRTGGFSVANVAGAVAYYARLAVVPWPLNFAPELPALPLVVTASIATAVAAVVVVIARRAALPMLLLALPTLPALYVAATVATPEKAIAERYLYLPSAGLCLLCGLGVARWRRAASIAIGAAVVFGMGTLARNAVWRTPLALWSDTVAKSPALAFAHEGYGFALLRDGRPDEGREELRIAARLDPALVDRYRQKGAAALRRAESTQAIIHLQAAVAMAPERAEAHLELANAYRAARWYAAAAEEYRLSLAISGESAADLNNLGILLAQAGAFDEAIVTFQRALVADPANESIRENMERALVMKRSGTPGPGPDMPPGHPPRGR